MYIHTCINGGWTSICHYFSTFFMWKRGPSLVLMAFLEWCPLIIHIMGQWIFTQFTPIHPFDFTNFDSTRSKLSQELLGSPQWENSCDRWPNFWGESTPSVTPLHLHRTQNHGLPALLGKPRGGRQWFGISFISHGLKSEIWGFKPTRVVFKGNMIVNQWI